MKSPFPVIAILCLLAAQFAQGQKPRVPAPAPPPVVSQAVSVRPGERATISLRIHGTRGEALEFLIRSQPRHGRLSAVRSSGMNSAVVDYTAPSKKVPDSDRFTYAVRGSEGVSAPGVVTIAIAEPAASPSMPAKLFAPSEIDFPSIITGERSTAEMEIANRGAGNIEGEVTVPPPWSIEGDRSYRLAPGSKTTIKVVFQPDKAGTFREDAVLSGTVRSLVTLRAVAEERLSVEPSELKLASQEGQQTRMGVLRVKNRSREEVKVAVVAGPKLMTDKSVVVGGRDEVGIPVFAEAGVVAAIEEKITLSTPGWSVTVPVRSGALEPILRFAAGEAMFGKVPAGEAVEGRAMIENLGGKPVSVHLSVEPPFQLRQQMVTIPANGNVEIPVRLPGTESGMHKAELVARGDGQVAKLALSAEVPEMPRTLAPAPIAAPPATADLARGDAGEAAPPGIDMPASLKEHPNGLGRFARDIQTTSAVIDWPANFGGTVSPRIEEQVLSLAPDGELDIKWSRLDGVRFVQDGERMRAELGGLKPGTLYTLRVVADHGERSEPVLTVQFWTRALKQSAGINWRLVFLLVAVGGLGFLVWRRWKSSAATGL